ncbi:MAG: ABC transporter substrate-binding protein [Hyphomicrobiales bacterium]|nr:ABC transporter substrate-binding protein [Hyphomicrobiales bacterium]
MKKLLFALALTGTMTIGTVFTALAGTPDDTFVIARNTADIINLDPAEVFEFSGAQVITNIYDRVMTFEPDNLTKLVGGTTESYTFSDDGKTITLKMRSGIVFHSGNPMTADDVAFSLQRVVKLKKTPSFIINQFGWNPDNVDKMVQVVDANTVKLTITADLSPGLVLNALSAGIGSVVDKKLVMSHEKDGDLGYEWLKTHSAGSGPYSLKTWKAGELIILEAHAKDRHGAPAMKRVILRHVAEASAQRLLLEKGDVDVAEDLTADQLKGLAGKSGVAIDTFPQSTLMYLAFNQKHEALSKPKVQEALRYAIDYKGLVGSVLDGSYKIHQAFWPSGMWASYDETPYSKDMAKAKALLAESGHGNGFKITIDTLNKSPFKEVAQSVQASLKELGIEGEIILSDGATLWPKYRARKHQLIIARWGPDYSDPHSNADAFAHNPDNRDEAKLTGKLSWRNAWANEGASNDAEAAAKETNLEKRAAMYQALQKKMQSDSSYAIMFQLVGKIGRRDNVSNYIRGATFDQVYFRTVTK